VILYAVVSDDVGDWAAVDCKQQRAKHRPLWDAHVDFSGDSGLTTSFVRPSVPPVPGPLRGGQGRVDHGSGPSEGHRNRENQWVGSGHVVVNLKICTFFHLTLKESLLLLILPQGDGIDKRHSATSRLRH